LWKGPDERGRIESTRVASDERVFGLLHYGTISNAGVQSSSAFRHSKEKISSRSNEYEAGERTRGTPDAGPSSRLEPSDSHWQCIPRRYCEVWMFYALFLEFWDSFGLVCVVGREEMDERAEEIKSCCPLLPRQSESAAKLFQWSHLECSDWLALTALRVVLHFFDGLNRLRLIFLHQSKRFVTHQQTAVHHDAPLRHEPCSPAWPMFRRARLPPVPH
jgi:hypothetical protein